MRSSFLAARSKFFARSGSGIASKSRSGWRATISSPRSAAMSRASRGLPRKKVRSFSKISTARKPALAAAANFSSSAPPMQTEAIDHLSIEEILNFSRPTFGPFQRLCKTPEEPAVSKFSPRRLAAPQRRPILLAGHLRIGPVVPGAGPTQFIIDAGHGRSGGVGRRAVHVAAARNSSWSRDKARPGASGRPEKFRPAARMVGRQSCWAALVLSSTQAT